MTQRNRYYTAEDAKDAEEPLTSPQRRRGAEDAPGQIQLTRPTWRSTRYCLLFFRRGSSASSRVEVVVLLLR